MNRYYAERLGPGTAQVRDCDTGYHTAELFVGDDAYDRAVQDAAQRNDGRPKGE